MAQEAGVFPSGQVRMWMQGGWREVMLMSFEITEEPERKHSPEVEDLATEAHRRCEKVTARRGTAPATRN